MTHIASVSTGRSDLGILAPVWRAIARHPGLTLSILLTGGHAIDDAWARRMVPEGVQVITAGADLGGEAHSAARAAAAILNASADFFEDGRPDIAFVIGDRLDMIPVAVASLPFNIPLAHLHGGEQTLGAVDDRIRHAITKLAHIHFAANADAATRIQRMGEEGFRIRLVGAPGLDAMLVEDDVPEDEFLAVTGLASSRGLLLVTVHSETNAADPAETAIAVLGALEGRESPILFTAPNSDPGAVSILGLLAEFIDRHPGAVLHESLGTRNYAAAMRRASAIVGNSSSALIEAPLFGLPAVNVGDRQYGRVRGANVIDVPPETGRIRQALDKVAGHAGSRNTGFTSPYGDGRSAERIADILASLPPREVLLRKQFATGEDRFDPPWDAHAH